MLPKTLSESRFAFFATVSLIFYHQIAWAQTTTPHYGHVKPNDSKTTQRISIFNAPGKDWKTCLSEEECFGLAWPLPGEKFEIKGQTTVTLAGKKVLYYEVEVKFPKKELSENGTKYIQNESVAKGYIAATNFVPDPVVDPCRLSDARDLTEALNKILEAESVKREKKSLAVEIPPKPGRYPTGNRALFGQNCQKFIDGSGQLGPWGKKLVKDMGQIDPGCFFGTEAGEYMDVKGVCPSFKNFTRPEREKFFAHVFACIALKESSCNPTIAGKGVNDEAVGLMQLEKSAEVRAVTRNHKYCVCGPGAPKIDAFSLDFQLKCATSIMSDLYCANNRPMTTVKKNYWQKLRGNWNEIPGLISQFPGCGRAHSAKAVSQKKTKSRGKK